MPGYQGYPVRRQTASKPANSDFSFFSSSSSSLPLPRACSLSVSLSLSLADSANSQISKQNFTGLVGSNVRAKVALGLQLQGGAALLLQRLRLLLVL
jgi:hypothetical protein